ncbi:MAG: hypothetical protein Harvfovirus17_20 [Harvfovirus sp.]|uniref:Tetratricopeptide repeat protein n=1 Tax=Harvfovirus sp. TaxID=2487768 RepID=A0A3G5A1L9_9VIRU|nr:MAG: hypothetical protein Harvfovirus17_20 [Harvfovirus sp.]
MGGVGSTAVEKTKGVIGECLGRKVALNDCDEVKKEIIALTDDEKKVLVDWYLDKNTDVIVLMGKLYETGYLTLAKDLDKAILLYKLASEKNNGSGCFQLGSVYVKYPEKAQGKDEGTNLLMKSAELKDSNGLIWLAGCSEKKMNYRMALEYLIEAVEVNPKNPVAHFELGQYYFRRRHLSSDYLGKTISCCENAGMLGHAEAYVELASLFYLESDYERSVQYYVKALELDPINKVALSGLLTTPHASKRGAAAIECFKEAVKQGSSDAAGHLGNIYRYQDEKQAVYFYTCEYELGNPAGYLNLAELYAKREPMKALEFLHQLMKKSPNDNEYECEKLTARIMMTSQMEILDKLFGAKNDTADGVLV